MIPDNLISFIQTGIVQKKGILFLGPNFAKTEEGKPLYNVVCEYFRDTPNKLDTSIESFVLLKNPKGLERMLFHDKLVKLYNAIKPSPLYQKIAEIPFHYIISASPDSFLKDAIKGLNPDLIFHYFDKSGSQSDLSSLNKWDKTSPLLFNLFGSISQDKSMILSYDDLFELVIAIIGQNEIKIPLVLSNEIVNADWIIFLGLDMEKWYVQIVLKKLFSIIEKGKKIIMVENSCIKNQDTKDFYNTLGELTVLDANADEIITEIHKGMAVEWHSLNEQNHLKHLKTEIKNALSEGNIKQALASLKFVYPDNDDIIIISGNYSDLEHNFYNASITEEYYTTQKSRIRKAILEILDELNQSDV